MSIRKMTFSLASLILILGLVFATAPAMAQAVDTTTLAFDAAAIIPAKGYAVISAVKNPTVADNGLPDGLTHIEWSNMPDLEKLFREEGGTLLLKATKTAFDDATPPAVDGTDYRFDHDGDDDGQPTPLEDTTLLNIAGDGIKDGSPADATATTHPDSDPRDAIGSDVVITEIMWALDENNIGVKAAAAHQWIEIYNNLDVAFPLKGVSLVAKSGRTGVPAATTTEIMLDRISNVIGAGWVFDIGQNGNSHEDSTQAFISMYRKERGKDGHTKGHWAASTQIYLAKHKGTPGAKERPGVKTFAKSGTGLKVVFNEVSNNTNEKYEWIELMVREGTPNFENWRVSIVESVGSDAELFTLPKLDTSRFGNLLLVTDTDPAIEEGHPLAVGYDVTKSDADNEGQGRDKNIKYIVRDFKKNLPDDGKFVLILRHGNDKGGTHEKVEDVAGWHDNLTKSDASIFTDLWPLINHGKPNLANNKLEAGVHRRQQPGILGTTTTGDGNHIDKTAFRDVGWQGVGYKRNADSTAKANGGTPGYPNNALRANNDADAIASVIISEVMAEAGPRNLPTWIELQNTSKAIAVNLSGWRLTITNHNDNADGTKFEGKLSEQFTLSGIIPPNQTSLVVSRRGRNDTKLPNSRIHTLDKKRTDIILNPNRFQIVLEAKKDSNYFHVDTVGNLGPAPEDSRRTDAQSFEPIAWELPSQVNEDSDRISLVRLTGKDGVPVHADGTMEGALVRFDMSNQIDSILDPTSYGHDSDISSPGHHPGGVLPVSLSKFRPERLKDTGEVVIRWITESETNNAGFNILRSDTRDGEFTKLHYVAGQGTTTERTLYEWKDKSAKPNVVYYYQIQDVSLDGDVTTLRTTHLRGNVTAAGKLTTTWGELKALQ